MIQEMDPYELEFYEYSIICDDPELLKKLENTYVDPDFDDYLNEFDKEQEQLQNQANYPEMPDPETISWSKSPKPQKQIPPVLGTEQYEIAPDTADIDDWEREE